MSLRPYLALVEAGARTVLHATLERDLGPEAHAALRAAGLTRPARAATSWPCDQGKRCAREIVDLVAACEESCGDGEPCPAIRLTTNAIAQETMGAGDLARFVARVFRVDGAPPKAIDDSGVAPIPLGAEASSSSSSPRDVFLALAPGDASFTLFLTLRERAPRGSLVLVPTARRVSSELAIRHAPEAHVEVVVLEDALVVRDGAIARGAKLRLVASNAEPDAVDPDAALATGPGIAGKLGATAWSEIKVTVVDGHTLRIQRGKRTLRRTYVDLGLASKTTREPTRNWELLKALCAGHGKFRWKDRGNFNAAKNAVFLLRKTLKEAFALEEDPFHEFTVVDGWKAKFFASSEIGEGEE